MTTPATRIDWMLADLAGERRTLSWYVERAEQGDRDAALIAIRKCVASLSPAALEQNGGCVGPSVVEALLRILKPAAASGDSKVLRAARKDENPNARKFARMWWWCVEMAEILDGEPDLDQIEAARRAQGDQAGSDGVPDAATVAKKYRELKAVIAAYRAEGEDE